LDERRKTPIHAKGGLLKIKDDHKRNCYNRGTKIN
jgi:hypothetical protein